MKIIRFLFIGFAAALLGAPLFAQNGGALPSGPGSSGAPGGVPYITRIQAESRNNLVRLNWVDSPALRGPVYIFRSRAPFNQNNPHDRIRPIEVPYGAQSYIDEVDEPGAWHYFISASPSGGARNDIFLPFVNAVSVDVEEFNDFGLIAGNSARRPASSPIGGPTGGSTSAPSGRPGGGAASAQAAPEQGIYALEASVRGDGALITFRQTTDIDTVILFRSVNPIRQAQDLTDAVIIESGVNSPFTDYPVPGISYYYALVPEADLLSAGNPEISPGRNATIRPVEIPVSARVGLRNSPEIRSMPLPLISVSAVSPLGGSAAETRDPVALSSPAEQASRGYAPGAEFNRRVYKSPRAFSQDLRAGSGGGEDYSLGVIVKGSFLARDWNRAREDLERYLSLPRSRAAEARARFYLGQVRYYSGAFREALFEFLLVQDRYPVEANEWIQASLARLVK
jgi:hypothetical protein